MLPAAASFYCYPSFHNNIFANNYQILQNSKAADCHNTELHLELISEFFCLSFKNTFKTVNK